MKLATAIIILLLILGLYYYTAETYDIAKVVGKYAYEFISNVYQELKEKSEKGDFDKPVEDIKERFED